MSLIAFLFVRFEFVSVEERRVYLFGRWVFLQVEEGDHLFEDINLFFS